MSQVVAYDGKICVWVVSSDECWGWQLGRRSASIKNAMVPMATFMKESGSSVIASQKRRCAGRRVSQWHKLCWSRAGVTLAGTTGQLSLKNFSWSHLQSLLTTCIFTTTTNKKSNKKINYSLPCRELPLPQCQVLSRGELTPQVSALVQCTLQTALKSEGYITLLMWPP